MEEDNYEAKKSKVSITLDPDILEKITELADNDDQSFSQFINMVLKEFITKRTDTDANTKNNQGGPNGPPFY